LSLPLQPAPNIAPARNTIAIRRRRFPRIGAQHTDP
jgi:hypothetical protein